jgi:hypothetical protein
VQDLFQQAQDEAERTHVITVECQAAFKALMAKMRFFKDRYFKMPPRTEGDWAALGFRARPASIARTGARRGAGGFPALPGRPPRANRASGPHARDAGARL